MSDTPDSGYLYAPYVPLENKLLYSAPPTFLQKALRKALLRSIKKSP